MDSVNLMVTCLLLSLNKELEISLCVDVLSELFLHIVIESGR